MSDNHRRHLAIKQGLWQFFAQTPTGRQAQYLNVLVAMISGLVGSRNAHLSSIAAKVPDGTKHQSRIKRFARWVANEHLDHAFYFAPFARAVLSSLAQQHRPLIIALDASTVGQGCLALLASVVYQGRALPLAWLVVQGSKGHLPEEQHLRLLHSLHLLVPSHCPVVVVADGEFDGPPLLAQLEAFGWHYVCRTAKSSWLWLGDDQCNFERLAVEPGSLVEIGEAVFTRAEYGPLTAIAYWRAEYAEPHYLVTNLELAQEALWYYRRRFHIETFFSDQKSRGFRLERSHLSDPKRLERLLLAACLAYLWLVYLGTLALVEGWQPVIHRTERCDLSLFSLGLLLLEHFLNEIMPLPVAFIPLWLEHF